ncbi:MAG: hypothetical protein K8R89_04355 [Anaerolineae bacterium]|nr:hypothetical protein [Anaerolineae bacterium]
MNRWIGLLMLLLVTVACTAVEEAAISPLQSPLESPLPTVEEPAADVIPLTGEEQAAITAKTLIAAREGIPVDSLTVNSITAVDWRDSCLGCARPDENCAMVITPGYRLLLQAGDAQYEVHTDATGKRARGCEGFAAPTQERPTGEVPATIWEQEKATLAVLTKNYPGFGLQQLEPAWEGTEVTEPGLLGAAHYRFTNADWSLRLVCPMAPDPVCPLALHHEKAGKLWSGEATGENVVRASASTPTLTYQVGECDKSLPPEELGKWVGVDINATTDGFHFIQRIAYTCCGEIVPAVGLDLETRTLRIITSNLGEICRCMCGYELTGEVGKLTAGSYTVEFWGVQKPGVHPLMLLETIPFEVEE